MCHRHTDIRSLFWCRYTGTGVCHGIWALHTGLQFAVHPNLQHSQPSFQPPSPSFQLPVFGTSVILRSNTANLGISVHLQSAAAATSAFIPATTVAVGMSYTRPPFVPSSRVHVEIL